MGKAKSSVFLFFFVRDVCVWECIRLSSMCVCVCLRCSHSDDSDQRACPSVGVWFLRLAGSTQPCQFSFSGLFVACVPLDLLCNAYKRFKGTGGLRRAVNDRIRKELRSTRGGNPQGWISSQLSLFREKQECCWAGKLQGNMHDKPFISWQLYFMDYYKSWTAVHC